MWNKVVNYYIIISRNLNIKFALINYNNMPFYKDICMETVAEIFENNLKSPSGNVLILDKKWKYIGDYMRGVQKYVERKFLLTFGVIKNWWINGIAYNIRTCSTHHINNEKKSDIWGVLYELYILWQILSSIRELISELHSVLLVWK